MPDTPATAYGARLEAALYEIVRAEIQVVEGSSGHPVTVRSRACVIAADALKLSRDELLRIARERNAIHV